MKSVRLRGCLAGLAVACLLSLLAFCILKVIELQRRSEARELAHGFSLRLVERVNEAAGGVYLLTAAVDFRRGEVVHFEELAEELLSNFPLLQALELAPGGVIWHVHPLRGNEAVIGHDLLLDKTRNREVHLAISRRQTAIAGPLALRQGGVGVLVRYPLYKNGPDGRSRFWGLSIGVIDFPSLLLTAGESEFARLGYAYELCWKPVGVNYCKNLKDEPVETPEGAEHMIVGLSQAEWQLNVTRLGGWLSMLEMALAALLIVAPAVAVGCWTGHARRSAMDPQGGGDDLSPPAG